MIIQDQFIYYNESIFITKKNYLNNNDFIKYGGKIV